MLPLILFTLLTGQPKWRYNGSKLDKMALTSSSGRSHRRSAGCLYNRPFGWSLWVLRRDLGGIWGWRALALLITILGKDTFSLVWRKSWKKICLSAVLKRRLIFDDTNQIPTSFKSTIAVVRDLKLLTFANPYRSANKTQNCNRVYCVLHDVPCGFPADDDLARDDNPELLRDEIRLWRKIQSRGRVSEMHSWQSMTHAQLLLESTCQFIIHHNVSQTCYWTSPVWNPSPIYHPDHWKDQLRHQTPLIRCRYRVAVRKRRTELTTENLFVRKHEKVNK